MVNRELIVLGGGGQASVIEEILRDGERIPVGYVAPTRSKSLEIPYLGDDLWLAAQDPSKYGLVNGIGSVGVDDTRQRVFDGFTALGFDFETVLHDDASVSPSATIQAGAQILAGAAVGVHARVGRNAVVNMSASINHHCRIGDHAHIAPGAILCGEVSVGANGFIGAGATIIQGVSVGARALVAAGATVIRDVPDGARVVGVPAQLI